MMKRLVLPMIIAIVLCLALGGTASAVTVTTIPLVGDPFALDISGHRISYLDFVSSNHVRVHAYNFSTGVDTEITPVAEDRNDPDIDGDIVVWGEGAGLGLYMYDFNAPVVGGTAIPDTGGDSFQPNLSGSILAWRETVPGFTISNIWYRQGTVSTQVTDLPNNQFTLGPDVSGNYIVWYWIDFGAADPMKIYFYDIAAPPVPGGTIFASNPANQAEPRVSDSNVVYLDNSDGTDWEVYLYPLPGGPAQKITNDLVDDSAADIGGNYIVWVKAGQVFMYDIAAGSTTQISDSAVAGINTSPCIDGNHVVWLNQNGEIDTCYLATIQDETPPVAPTLPYTGR